jgi:disulfide bond formation protein DsbB
MNLYMYQRIVGTGVLALHVLLVLVLAYFVYRKLSGKKCEKLENFVYEQRMRFVFVFGLFATIGSFIFSDVYFVEPCKLCWFQRAFVYPQVIIAGVALMKRDISAWLNLRIMSIIGLVIAVYQMMAQFGVSALPKLACVAEAGADCAKITMLEYGYITIPVMSATFFLVVILLSLMKRK